MKIKKNTYALFADQIIQTWIQASLQLCRTQLPRRQRLLAKTIESLFVCILCSYAHANILTTYYTPRSQSMNTPRRIAGTLRYQQPSCIPNALFTADICWSQSFDESAIRGALFGTKQECPIIITGSTVPNRNSTTQWLADNFYLPTDFQSKVSFKPRIQTAIIDLYGYLELNDWWPGLYVSIFAPFVHTNFKLGMHERITGQASAPYQAGYFTPAAVPANALLQNFSQYAQGRTPQPITQLSNATDPMSTPITTNFESLNAARMTKCKHGKTGFADVRAYIGYNFFNTDEYYASSYIEFAAPTGNRPTGKYLFEPMIGNGHHAELGIGTQAFYLFQNCNALQIAGYVDIHISHLFGTNQRRTFDLKNRPFSRYMLAEKISSAVVDDLSGNPEDPPVGTVTPANAQFAAAFTPVANLTTLQIHVSAAAQAEITALISSSYNNCTFDIGYNFWIRSTDSFDREGPLSSPLARVNSVWALKGDARVYGFTSANGTNIPANTAIALSATESQATIASTRNSADTAALANTGIDNPQFAYADTDPIALKPLPTSLATDHIQTSIQPVALTLADIDCSSSKTRGMSSMLFASVTQYWCCDDQHCAFLTSIGGQVEFGNKNNVKNCVVTTALSQWTLWIKAGVTFS